MRSSAEAMMGLFRPRRWRYLFPLGGLLLLLAGCRQAAVPSAGPTVLALSPVPPVTTGLPQGTLSPTRIPVPTRNPLLPTDTPAPTVAPLLVQSAVWEGAFVSSLAWFPDGRTLAVATGGGLLLADGQTLAEVDAIRTERPVGAVAASPDGSLLALGITNDVQLWWKSGAEWQQRQLEGEQTITQLAFSPDGALVAASDLSGTVRVWDVTTDQPVNAWLAHQGEAFAVAFSPDGTLLATAGRDGNVRLWRVSTWDEVAALPHADVAHGVAFSPDGSLLAVADWDGTVRLWDVASHEQVRALRGPATLELCVAFSPDGSRVVAGGMDGSVRLWNAATGQLLAWTVEHWDPVRTVAFSPDGTRIASGGWDATVRLWAAQLDG